MHINIQVCTNRHWCEPRRGYFLIISVQKMCVHLETHVFENAAAFVYLFFRVGLSSPVTQVSRKKSALP